jgi:hypothetical protein
MTGQLDQWLQLAEIAKMFGLSEESIKRLARAHGFPLRRLTPHATPGVFQSELIAWFKAQPKVGPPIRVNRPRTRKQSNAKKLKDDKLGSDR